MSKGSKRRPMAIPAREADANWQRTFAVNADEGVDSAITVSRDESGHMQVHIDTRPYSTANIRVVRS